MNVSDSARVRRLAAISARGANSLRVSSEVPTESRIGDEESMFDDDNEVSKTMEQRESSAHGI